MEHLRVYKPECPKVRLGRPHDGGYIICELPNSQYDICLSGGVCDDMSFEEDIVAKYGLECVCFDGSINALPNPQADKRISFVKKYLGDHDDDATTTLRSYFDTYENIFMKMDIEGGEDALFSALTDVDLTKIKQLVIEFHTAHQFTIPNRLSQTHWLVHFHGNNYAGTTSVNDVIVPDVFECTYIRKNETNQLPYNTDPIPNPSLDQRNSLCNEDIVLSGPPFVHQ